MGASLITKAAYKAYVGINSPNYDAEIDSLIVKVSQLVKTYCRQSFVDHIADPKVEHFNGGTTELLLKEWPIIAVSAVEISQDYGQNYTEMTQYVDWVLDPTSMSIRAINPQGFVGLISGYKVTYTAGYEALPEDLALAVMDLITYYRKNDSAVHSSKAPGTNSVQIEYISSTTLPAHIRRILDQYVADYA